MLNIPAGWKPISSAPKDGTEILAWRSDCGQFIASYTSADSFPMTQDELDAWDEETLFAKDWFTQWPQAYRLEGIEVPTHWMPLPDAPGSVSPSAPGDAQDERQAFEAWAEDQGFVLDCDFFEVSGQYYDQDDTQLAYDIWRAARASVAATAAGDALDAQRYRWLRDQTETDGIAIVMKDMHFDESRTCAENIDKFIDAALAAQVPQQGEA
ncbi:hypothetical protein [Achromobacter denitrificans]|uniref:hypothetical protein n=1 Tax=Achromobacter denitrificans TaxID=32002 RepID=UPI000F67AD7B|nr:hypothetical protein [Achromobacter denitrificans]RSE85539.1 hypothetical protein EGU64_12615 [Achromobacter denitrificans]